MMYGITIDIPDTPEGYQKFIRCKQLQSYTVKGRVVYTDEASYREIFGEVGGWNPPQQSAPHLMPFQADITQRALDRERFALFADCGLGKTPMGLAWAMAVADIGKVLILCPLAVLEQWKREATKFHGITLIDLRKGETWDNGIAIANYERRVNIDTRGCAGVILDESSILKNNDGTTHKWLHEVRENVPFRLALSATPAPNSHFEYACHASWLGISLTVKEYCSRYMKKDGTRWVLRGHAIEPFYVNLSTWATYIQSPLALGYEQTTEMPCEPDYRYVKMDTPPNIVAADGSMFASADRAADRSLVFGQLRCQDGPRMDAIEEYAQGKRLIVWVARNAEEKAIAARLPGTVAVINGPMEVERRVELVDAYRAGEIDHIVSKPKVLGFGVNMPECDHMVYSGFGYSFEEFYQAVRRAHRYGRKGRLEVMVPYTYPEAAMLSALREKMARFDTDVAEMQRRFWSKA